MKILKILFVLLILAPLSAVAQGTNISLGEIRADPNAPVEIGADSLTIDQETGRALFEGNVVVGQGDLRLGAQRVEVFYSETTGNVTRLLASGGVTFVTSTEAAEANNADYNLAAGTLILSGSVLLSQGASAISADEMHINLSDGSAQMTGRVRTVFTQGN